MFLEGGAPVGATGNLNLMTQSFPVSQSLPFGLFDSNCPLQVTYNFCPALTMRKGPLSLTQHSNRKHTHMLQQSATSTHIVQPQFLSADCLHLARSRCRILSALPRSLGGDGFPAAYLKSRRVQEDEAISRALRNYSKIYPDDFSGDVEAVAAPGMSDHENDVLVYCFGGLPSLLGHYSNAMCCYRTSMSKKNGADADDRLSHGETWTGVRVPSKVSN